MWYYFFFPHRISLSSSFFDLSFLRMLGSWREGNLEWEEKTWCRFGRRCWREAMEDDWRRRIERRRMDHREKKIFLYFFFFYCDFGDEKKRERRGKIWKGMNRESSVRWNGERYRRKFCEGGGELGQDLFLSLIFFIGILGMRRREMEDEKFGKEDGDSERWDGILVFGEENDMAPHKYRKLSCEIFDEKKSSKSYLRAILNWLR